MEKKLTNESGQIRKTNKPKGSIKKAEPSFWSSPSPIYFPKKKRKK